MEQFKKLNYKELQDIQGGSSLFDIPWVKNLLQPKRPIVGLPTPVNLNQKLCKENTMLKMKGRFP